jgi:HD-GYP domain-containing protein (c-di-GMP phosphodiesterase class II)
MNDVHGGPARGDGRERGGALVARFNAALRGARMYGAQSPTLQQLVGELLELAQSLIEEELTMVVMGDYFYINDMRLKPQPSQITLFRALMTEFEDRGLGGVRFQNGVTIQELSAFLQMMSAVRDAEQGEKLPEEVMQAGIMRIIPIRARDLQNDAQDDEEPMERTPDGERRRAQRTFWRAVNGTRNLVLGAAKSGRPALRQARRLVQPMVDSLMKNEYSILGLTAIKDHDEYTYAHCVNVSVLSIGMGQALGLPRMALANLGVAGLLHDIGKIEVPVGVLQKPGKLSPEEWQVVRRHPLEGLKMVSRMPGLTALTVEAMRVCFEHHMTVDRGGYPQFTTPHEPATSSRIVAVADFFDAITAHRSYRRRPLTSFEALSMLLGPEREHFDPAVLWALVKSVGLYPAGTVMLTKSNHVVLSVSPNPEDRRRPHCRVLVHPDGTTPPEEQPEMWDPMPATESVARVLQPEEHAVPAGSLAA